MKLDTRLKLRMQIAEMIATRAIVSSCVSNEEYSVQMHVRK